MLLQTWRTVSARHEPEKPIRVLANGAGSVTSAPCSPDPGIFHVFDDEIIPATGLLLSLFFQLLMLITGWLRKRTSKASAFAWTAYVSADILVFYLLGLLTRTQSHTEVYGLWSAVLIYHLGGPDNFTAYERADSELWMRHLLSLLQQVGTAAYVIAVNTRGWLLIPTLNSLICRSLPILGAELSTQTQQQEGNQQSCVTRVPLYDAWLTTTSRQRA